MPGGNDTLAYRKRVNPTGTQLLNKMWRRRLGESYAFFTRRPIEHRAIFTHNAIEESSVGEDPKQVVKLAAGCKD